jgi:hypothetical protein
MTTIRPDISPGSRVCHWPTRERGVIVSALPAGYSDWLYIFQPDDAPTVRRYCGLDALASFDNVTLLAAFRPMPMTQPEYTPPSGGKAA